MSRFIFIILLIMVFVTMMSACTTVPFTGAHLVHTSVAYDPQTLGIQW